MPSVDLPMSEDTYLSATAATTNYSTNTSLGVGESNAGTNLFRSLIKPDFSSVPDNAIFKSAILKLTPITDLSSTDTVVYCHRIVNSTIYTEATWNLRQSGSGWISNGCSSPATDHASGDYDASVIIGSMSVVASPTLNVQLEMTLDAAKLRQIFDGTYTNYGMVLFTEDQLNDQILYASTDHATSAYRPIITLTYSVPGGSAAWFY